MIRLCADMAIISMGLSPNQISPEAGLKVNERGAVIVNSKMQTSNPNIFAIGDLIETIDFITKEKTYTLWQSRA